MWIHQPSSDKDQTSISCCNKQKPIEFTLFSLFYILFFCTVQVWTSWKGFFFFLMNMYFGFDFWGGRAQRCSECSFIFLFFNVFSKVNLGGIDWVFVISLRLKLGTDELLLKFLIVCNTPVILFGLIGLIFLLTRITA